MDMRGLSPEQLAKMERSLRRSLDYCRKMRTRMFKLRWPHDDLWTKTGKAEDALDALYGLVRMLEGEAKKTAKR
jgi:hypothetical protein